MKNLFFFICLFFISITISAQRTYVPDDNFEQALIRAGLDDVIDNYVLTSNISGTTSLAVQNSRFGAGPFGIQDLTGIEDFVSLITLDCSSNNLTHLDFSSNTALEVLVCDANDLTSIDVISNSRLRILNCENNDLTHLSVRANSNLEILYCNDNNIMRLDVSLNPVLKRLHCFNNALTFLNVKNGNNVNFDRDLLRGLSFSARGNIDLTCIQVDDRNYSDSNPYWSRDRDASYNEKCYAYIPDDAFEQHLIDLGHDSGPLDDYVYIENIREVIGLFMQNKGISDLTGIECFTAMGVLDCSSNNLTSLDLSQNAYLLQVNCRNNNLTSLAVGGLLETLDCSDNNLTELDIDQPELQELYCENNDLTSLNVRANSLITLSCGNNDLTLLSVESTSLISVSCSNNNLTSLGINGAYRLSELGCNNNSLRYLDLDRFNLTYLSCSNNNLTSIENIGSNRELSIFNCSDNNITSLDLTSNYALNDLNCSNNNLSSLNVKSGYNDRNLNGFNALNNPNLICIQVDDVDYSNTNWSDGKDAKASFGEFCFTLLPDNDFEQALIDRGLDDVLDNQVLTSNISDITTLSISKKGISDLTGIKYFSALEALNCYKNNLTNLDLSSNTALKNLDCSSNKLENLNIKNGNNANFTGLNTTLNASLTCIKVDFENIYLSWGTSAFKFDSHTNFSQGCIPLSTNDAEINNYQMYPNPVSNILTIESKTSVDNITVINVQGVKVLRTNKQTIDFSRLQSGIYILKLERDNQVTYKRVVKK